MHDNYYACICFSIGSTVSQWLLLQVPVIIIVRQLKNYSIIGKFNSALLQQNTKTCASFSLNKSQLSSFWAPRLCTCMLDQRSKGGGHSHRCCIQSCDRGKNAVKRSRHFLGIGQMVKRCSGPQLQHNQAAKRRGRDLCMHSQSIVNGSRTKFAVVKQSRPFLDGQKS